MAKEYQFVVGVKFPDGSTLDYCRERTILPDDAAPIEATQALIRKFPPPPGLQLFLQELFHVDDEGSWATIYRA